MALNDRQERFCREYLIDVNGAHAAIRAGYSERGAKQTAHKLLARADVQARVAELMTARNEELEADAAWVLRELLELARVDVGAFYDESNQLRPVGDLDERARKALVSIKSRRIANGLETVTEIRLADRLRLLELIGKHAGVGAWTADEHDGVPVVVIRDYSGKMPPGGDSG